MNKQYDDIQNYIRCYQPKHWTCPISDVDFTPYISVEDLNIILNGKIPASPQYKAWYVKEAITTWQKENGIKIDNI